MRNFQKGEIATIVIFGSLIVLGVSALISSFFMKDKLTINSKANETNCSSGWFCYDECADQSVINLFTSAYGNEGKIRWMEEKANNLGENGWYCLGECASQSVIDVFGRDKQRWMSEKLNNEYNATGVQQQCTDVPVGNGQSSPQEPQPQETQPQATVAPQQQSTFTGRLTGRKFSCAFSEEQNGATICYGGKPTNPNLQTGLNQNCEWNDNISEEVCCPGTTNCSMITATPIPTRITYPTALPTSIRIPTQIPTLRIITPTLTQIPTTILRPTSSPTLIQWPTSTPIPTPTNIPIPTLEQTNQVNAVILDPGHGSPDIDPKEGKSPEGALNLKIAQRTRAFLAQRNVTALLTHERNTGPLTGNNSTQLHYDEFHIRAHRINELARQSGARLFVSIHFDSSPYGSRGPSAYYNNERNFSNLNLDIAKTITSTISLNTGDPLFRTGIQLDKYAGGCCGPLYLLGPKGKRTIEDIPESEIIEATEIPGALVEYFPNGVSYDNIKNNDQWVDRIAKGYADGIVLYLQNH